MHANSAIPPYWDDYIQLIPRLLPPAEPVMMNSDVNHYIETVRDEFEVKLREWVEIPTISAEPEHRTDIDRGADAAVQYLRSLGADAQTVTTPGNPVVIGKFVTGPRSEERRVGKE